VSTPGTLCSFGRPQSAVQSGSMRAAGLTFPLVHGYVAPEERQSGDCNRT